MFPTLNDEPRRDNERDGKRREVFLTDGNTAIFESKDPYGFWSITYQKGRTPSDLLDQNFTSYEAALRHYTIWLNQNRYDTKISPVKVTIPEVDLKKKGVANAS